MLVRKLKVGDRITIGSDVVLECQRSSGGTLQLAITAPDAAIILHEKPSALSGSANPVAPANLA